jgi:hypothetical protein
MIITMMIMIIMSTVIISNKIDERGVSASMLNSSVAVAVAVALAAAAATNIMPLW